VRQRAAGVEEAIMSLQMQLRRGVIALLIGLALGLLALGRAHDAAGTAARGVGSVIRAVDGRPECSDSLRIDIARDLRVTVNCAGACAPMSRVLDVLRVDSTQRTRCTVRSA
jgi:hypothetical protein